MAKLTLLVDARQGIKALTDFDTRTNKTTRSVADLASRVKSDFNMIGRVINAAIAPVKIMAGAFVSAKAAVIAAGAASLKAAGEYQMFNQQLRAIIKTKEDADRAFRESIEFSVRTPFTPKEIIETRIALESVGIQGEKAVLRVAEAAAVMNRDILDVARALKSMEVEPLRNLGIMRGEIEKAMGRDDWRKTAEGFRAAQEAVMSIFEDRFGGKLGAMSVTWPGVISTLAGAIHDLRATFASGFVVQATVLVEDINKGIAAIKDDANGYGEALGDRLTKAHAGLVAAFRVGMDMASQINKVLHEENGLGRVIHEALRAGALMLGDALVTAISASIPIWKTVGTILGQGVLDALYRSGLPFAKDLLASSVKSNLSGKSLAELHSIGANLGVSGIYRGVEPSYQGAWSPMGSGGTKMVETSRQKTQEEMVRDLTAAISKLPVEDQLAYAQFDPAKKIAEEVPAAIEKVVERLEGFSERFIAIMQQFSNNIDPSGQGVDLLGNYKTYFDEALAEITGRTQDIRDILNQQKEIHGAAGATGGIMGGEGASAVSQIKEYMQQLRTETDLVGLNNEQRERRQIIMEAELAAQQDYESQLRKTIGLTNEETEAINRQVDALQKASRLRAIAQGVGDAWRDAFHDITFGAKSAGDAMKQLGMDIAEAIWQKTMGDSISNLVADSIIGAFSGGWGMRGSMTGDINPGMAAFAHTGWDVGTGYAARRAVDPMLFVGAPRLHSGLRPGEFPAILEHGERVQSKEEVAAERRAGGPSVTFNVQNNSSAQVEAEQTGVQYDGKRMVVGMVLRDKRNNGPMSRANRRR